jgi:hypothetical protein
VVPLDQGECALDQTAQTRGRLTTGILRRGRRGLHPRQVQPHGPERRGRERVPARAGLNHRHTGLVARVSSTILHTLPSSTSSQRREKGQRRWECWWRLLRHAHAVPADPRRRRPRRGDARDGRVLGEIPVRPHPRALRDHQPRAAEDGTCCEGEAVELAGSGRGKMGAEMGAAKLVVGTLGRCAAHVLASLSTPIHCPPVLQPGLPPSLHLTWRVPPSLCVPSRLAWAYGPTALSLHLPRFTWHVLTPARQVPQGRLRPLPARLLLLAAPPPRRPHRHPLPEAR